MAFVPLPVQKEADEKLHAEQHAGFRLMDEMLQANDKEKTPRADIEAFFALVERVAQNILDAPGDPKFQRLKTSSKGYAPVKNVRMGERVMDYMGFRDRVENLEHWNVLRTEGDWQEGLRRRAELVKKQYDKRKDAEEHEVRGATAKAEADKRHKDELLARIHEERKERK